MVRLDTFKVEIPRQAVLDMNRDAFIEKSDRDMANDAVTSMVVAKSKSLPIGVSRLNYKPGASYQVEFSAKVLGQDYLDGININNWFRFADALSDVMKVDVNRMWDENPRVLKCDTTDNIPMTLLDCTKRDVCYSLRDAKMNDRFTTKKYESRKKLGVEFHGDQDEKNRIIVYDKHLDLLKRANRDFMRSLPDPGKMLKDAEGVIRFETNHTDFRNIRKRFNVEDTTLQSVLSSQAKVNHDFLCKALGRGAVQTSLLSEYHEANHDGQDIFMVYGVKYVYEYYKGDLSAIRQLAKEFYGENWRYQYYKAKTSIQSVALRIKSMSTRSVNAVPLDDLVKRVLSALLAA